MQRVYDGISEAALSESSTPGITTGIKELDGTILGMGPGDFILVASRPGMGKTSIGLNIALSAAKSTGKTVAVFSLEMTREQLVMRLLAGEGLVDSKSSRPPPLGRRVAPRRHRGRGAERNGHPH